MPASTATYITDVAYPAHYHREMMPQWLHACLTGLGVDAPKVEDAFTWLELGCGSAVNMLAAAANYPHARFVGVDISAREIAQAQQWAALCGLDNVQLVCADLGADSAADALLSALNTMDRSASASAAQGFDYIVCHGVYSWVSPALREAIHQRVQRLLLPQGIVYLAYNSQPGAASLSATQRLIDLNAQRLNGSSAEKVRNGLDLVMALAKGGAGNYVEQPAALRELERINTMEDAYLAHEFLNRHWCAHHVADVIEALEQAGCSYVGSATAIENINAVSLPGKLQALFAHMQAQGIQSAQIETAKDIARNQNMRRDLYQKSASNTPEGSPYTASLLSESEHRRRLLAQVLRLLPAAGQATPNAKDTAIALPTRIGLVELPVAQVQPLFKALENGCQSYAALAQLPAYQANPGILNVLLQTLAWAGWIEFVQLASSPQQAAHIAERVQRLRSTLQAAGLQELASRVDCLVVA